MPKKLVAVIQRHGDTDANDMDCYRSRLDPPLNSKGMKQAEDAADNLEQEDLGIERIITSPLLRACTTADIIAEHLELPVEQDRGLLSWALGFLSGKDKKTYEPILGFFIDNPKETIPDGESLDEMEQRVYEFFSKEFKNDTLTLFVTHTSNLVTLENLIHGDHAGRPEVGAVSVDTGGTVGIYVDDNGRYSTEILFGKSKPAEFGS
jgi:broad specificity phosphatase PhoE